MSKTRIPLAEAQAKAAAIVEMLSPVCQPMAKKRSCAPAGLRWTSKRRNGVSDL